MERYPVKNPCSSYPISFLLSLTFFLRGYCHSPRTRCRTKPTLPAQPLSCPNLSCSYRPLEPIKLLRGSSQVLNSCIYSSSTCSTSSSRFSFGDEAAAGHERAPNGNGATPHDGGFRLGSRAAQLQLRPSDVPVPGRRPVRGVRRRFLPAPRAPLRAASRVRVRQGGHPAGRPVAQDRSLVPRPAARAPPVVQGGTFLAAIDAGAGGGRSRRRGSRARGRMRLVPSST